MIIRILLYCFLLLQSLSIKADERYIENIHYTIIDREDEPLLIEEVFSYFCIHCYRFQPVIKRLQDKLPDSVTLEKNYISHVSSRSAPINSYIAKFRLIAKKNQVVDTFDEAVFHAVHREKLDISSEEDLDNLLIDSGLSSLISEGATENNEIIDIFLNIKSQNLNLVKNKVVVSLPTLIVRGKYRVNISSLDSNSIDDDIYDLIIYLMNK